MKAYQIEPTFQQQDDLFSAIRGGFSWVAKKAKHVTINKDALDRVASTIKPVEQEAVFDDEHHFTGSLEDITAYVLVLDTINFGSGYEPYLKSEGWEFIDHSIYFSISTRVKSYFDENGAPSPQKLSCIKLQDVADMLQIDTNYTYGFDFCRIATLALREFGTELVNFYGGDYMRFVAQASGYAANMVSNLSHLKYFNDVHDYSDMQIPFYKRAQITAADLHLAYKKQGQELFSDIANLTMFADNSVPSILHHMDILEYSPTLTEKVRTGKHLKSGSEEEIEIRAVAGHAVELISGATGLSAMDIDHALWHKNAEISSTASAPLPHYTLCSFY